MSGGGSKRQSLPPRPPPVPTPETIQDASLLSGEQERRSAKRRKGRQSLILTEPSLGDTQDAPQPKKSLLG